MARLYYMALPGAGPWDSVIKEVGSQLRPYESYLRTARDAAENRKPMLAWREPTEDQRRMFQRRLVERHQDEVRRAQRASRRRDRHVRDLSTGVWIVLEPPSWRREEPDNTFDAFLDAREVFDNARCENGRKIAVNDRDREGRALLVDRLPNTVKPNDQDDLAAPTAGNPHGPILWLSPNTYALKRQLHAVWDLENAPAPRLAPLIQLVSKRVAWKRVETPVVWDDQWEFLRTDRATGELREGTDEQRRFVSMALGTPDFALLEGPPGSGKTTAICELIVQLARQGQRVLLVASTHVAVDNVLERLIEWQDRPETQEKLILPVRIGDETRVTSKSVEPWVFHHLKRTWRDNLKDFLESPTNTQPGGEAARGMLLESLNRANGGDESPFTRLLLESANLVCGTTIGILQHPGIKHARRDQRSFGESATQEPVFFQPFDVMILDEASKTTFSEFLVPALYASRWIVVGDTKQLSPYVEETDLADNVRGLVSDGVARAAVHAFYAMQRPGKNGALARSVVATSSSGEKAALKSEAAARDVSVMDLDEAEPVTLGGIDGALPELMFADVVVGSPDALQRFEHRLPVDALAYGGPLPDLPDWDAAKEAFVSRERDRGRSPEEPDGPLDWGQEVAWRLIRSFELRQNEDERRRYLKELDELLPVSRAGVAQDADHSRSSLKTRLDDIRRVALPSVLELLQCGFERLPNWSEDVALTGGLPKPVLDARMVSLTYQGRMHPHVSAFSREKFYTRKTDLTDQEQALLRMYGPDYRSDQDFLLGPALLGELERARKRTKEQRQLLVDARGLEQRRKWSYPRYARHAQWIAVDPDRRKGKGQNSNVSEADKVIEELKAFVSWAVANPRPPENGRSGPWEVAVLTFYRGQEAVLRERLQRWSGLTGNTRHFHFPLDQRAVEVTLCTVDRFQGHEADFVILSFVKSRSVGFLNSPNRLNVALTRARFQVVLIGHQAFFKRCHSQLLRDLAASPHYQGDIVWEVSK